MPSVSGRSLVPHPFSGERNTKMLLLALPWPESFRRLPSISSVCHLSEWRPLNFSFRRMMAQKQWEYIRYKVYLYNVDTLLLRIPTVKNVPLQKQSSHIQAKELNLTTFRNNQTPLIHVSLQLVFPMERFCVTTFKPIFRVRGNLFIEI